MVFLNRAEHKGLGYTYNEALQYCNPEGYICYLGDDDFFYPDHVSRLAFGLDHSDCIGAYSLLYKTFYDKFNKVVAKNIEVARQFSRPVMMMFSHVLGGSFMHRYSAIDLIGGYDEELPMLLDMDYLRQMCFFGDFKYIPVITGEYTSQVRIEDMDRVSAQQEKDPALKAKTISRIHSKHPKSMVKSRIPMMDVIVCTSKMTKPGKELIDNIREKTFYPITIIQPTSDTESFWKYLYNALTLNPDRLCCLVYADYPMAKDETPWCEHYAFSILELLPKAICYESYRGQQTRFPMYIFDRRLMQFMRFLDLVKKAGQDNRQDKLIPHTWFTQSGYEVKIAADPDPYEMDKLVLEASLFKVGEAYESAAEIYRTICRRWPENGFIYSQKLAECYYQLKFYWKASVMLNQLPFPTTASLMLEGLCALKLGREPQWDRCMKRIEGLYAESACEL